MTTLLLTISIAFALYSLRHRGVGKLRGAWRSAKWWEKLVLLLALAPIPGPFDELAGLLVLRRIARRS